MMSPEQRIGMIAERIRRLEGGIHKSQFSAIADIDFLLKEIEYRNHQLADLYEDSHAAKEVARLRGVLMEIQDKVATFMDILENYEDSWPGPHPVLMQLRRMVSDALKVPND